MILDDTKREDGLLEQKNISSFC